jgi:hypothetical protein
VLLFSAFAQVSAIGAVAELDLGREGDLRTSLRWGRHSFVRYFGLLLAFIVVLAVISSPFYLLAWLAGGGTIFPCLAWMMLAVVYLVALVLAAIMLELSARYLVLEDRGIFESIQMAGILLWRHWRESVVTWLYVMLIMLVGTLVMVVVLALLGTPLAWLFSAATEHHNAFTIALSMLAFMLAWGVAAAVAGIFAITGSAVWTMTFLDLEPAAYRG